MSPLIFSRCGAISEPPAVYQSLLLHDIKHITVCFNQFIGWNATTFETPLPRALYLQGVAPTDELCGVGYTSSERAARAR